MNAQSETWKFWSNQTYASSCPSYCVGHADGTPAEPGSSIWCASLLESARDRLSGPFVILDWGCGDGRLLDFMTRRFKEFEYYGIERPGEHGSSRIVQARASFASDPRAKFDVYDTPLEKEAVGRAGIVVMGSVATHIPIPMFEILLSRILPVLERGGVLISSFFIRDRYAFQNGTCYGHDDCYRWVSYTQEQVDGICQKMGLSAEQKELFDAGPGCIHQILRFQKKQ